MRSGLFWKLLGAQLVVVATILLAALWLLRLHAADSFRSYLQAEETRQLAIFRDEVLEGLERYQDWSQMLAAQAEALPGPRAVRQRRPDSFSRHHGPRLGPEARPGAGPGRGPGPGQPHHRAPSGPPLQPGGNHQPLIVTPQGTVVFPPGAPPAPGDSLRLPIQWRDTLMGYVVQPRRGEQRQQAEADFEARQNRAYLQAAMLALAIATALAALIAAWLARRVRAIERGTRAFADRDFAARVSDPGRDELSRLAGQVNRLGIALAAHERRQKQWLADVAHELRTPLAVLQGELEALLEGVRRAGPEALSSLQEEVARLSRLVEDLNLLSLAESGGLRLQREPGDLRDLLDDVHERFNSVLAAAGFTLQLALPSTAASYAYDHQRLEQVLGNLVSNLLRYATPGPVKLSLHSDAAGHWIRLEDAGPGVSEEWRQHLFDRFYQVDGARHRTPAGSSGLGLAICRSLVEAHDGHIRAEDAGGGLGIVIELPARAALRTP